MRKVFSEKVEQLMVSNTKTVFITADLGFNTFEKLQIIAKNRFINAGIAEQSILGIASGLAHKGHETFVYNIASFAIFRCFEQLKIDVCLHDLPVYIVGNGGGYGYGVMGATHHALEDIGCVSTLPNITCWIPAFEEDVDYCISQITSLKKPAYLRLGLGKHFEYTMDITRINHIVKSQNTKITIITLGPIVQNALEAISNNQNIDLFTIIAIPIIELSEELEKSIQSSKKVIVIEEHVERGGLGEHLLSIFAKNSIQLTRFVSLHAKGYPNNVHGDQYFYQKESGLDTENIQNEISKLLNI